MPKLIILILAGILLFSGMVGQENDIVVYVESGNLAGQWFAEPFESMILITKHFDYVSITNHLENMVICPVSTIEMILEKKHGVKIKDLIFVIHCHSFIPKFSSPDKSTMRAFRTRGFVGLFGLYIQMTGSLIWE